MTRIETLLSISSPPLATKPLLFPELLRPYAQGPELFLMLQEKNGFYAFESALHVFPVTGDPASGLAVWNAAACWRSSYQDLTDDMLFFAEDILQDQFCLSLQQSGVFRFHAETGETTAMAASIEDWAGVVLDNYRVETGWPLASEWQKTYGILPQGKRLLPKTPFFLGGSYDVENLWAGEAEEGMRFKGDVAVQTRNLQDGTKVNLVVGPTPD
jgi:hypothetical protein